MKGRSVKALFSLLLFLFSALALASQEKSSETILVMLATGSSEDSEDENIRELIDNALSIELHIRDFAIVTEEMRRTERLISLGNKNNASYIIQSLYSMAGDMLTVSFSLIRARDGAVLHEKDFESLISLELDRALNLEIADMVMNMAEDMTENPALVTIITPEPEEESEETAEFRHFTISTGLSPFFTTGDASTYFAIGLLPELHGQYRFQLGVAYLGLGLFLSMNYSIAEGSASSSEIILLSGGPEFRFGFILNSRFEAFVSLNGGISMFFLNRDDDGFQYTFIPCMSGGLGLDMQFTDLFGIYLSADYSIYFENSVYITGFSPSVGVCFSL